MMAPVQQVRARHMSPVVDTPFLIDVSHVMAAAPEHVAVWIKGHRQPLRAHEVIGRSIGVPQHLESHVPRGMELIVRYGLIAVGVGGAHLFS